MKDIFKQLLLIRAVRVVVCKLRFYYYARLRNRIKTLESKDAIDHTIKHNLKSIGVFGLTRMDMLIKPVSVLENVSKDARILVIGPRNEDDIMNLVGNGFKTNNIIGLDLISYSPFVEVGDMHNTRFTDSYFDIIICGWTLSYSNEPQKFADEALRIIRNKGIIAIGVEYSLLTNEQSINLHEGYDLRPNNFERINSLDQILNLFKGHVQHLYFNHDAPNKISHGEILDKNVSNIIAIFSIFKN
jgi:SAM-dependent methyltransferase